MQCAGGNPGGFYRPRHPLESDLHRLVREHIDEFFVASPCKQRCICPSCHQKRVLLLAIHIAEDVAEPVAHPQFVWTIPKRLPNLPWQTVCEVYHAVLGCNDVVPGAIITIQTFGQLIHFCEP